MDSNHRSTGYEPVGISWLPHPATGFADCLLVILQKDYYHEEMRNFPYSGGWIRTIGLRVMSPSGSPGYPTPLRGFILQALCPRQLSEHTNDYLYTFRSPVILQENPDDGHVRFKNFAKLLYFTRLYFRFHF